MRYWTDEETGTKLCEPDCVDEWLFDILAIGVDYDGCHNAEDLKGLIDDLVGMANKARECLWTNKLFGIHGSPNDIRGVVSMAEPKNKEVAISYIEGQLENGYIDLGCHDKDELEIVKEAIEMWKAIDKFNRTGCTIFMITTEQTQEIM